MSEAGIVSQDRGSQARDILITTEEWHKIKAQMDHEAADGATDSQGTDQGVPATIDNQDIRD